MLNKRISKNCYLIDVISFAIKDKNLAYHPPNNFVFILHLVPCGKLLNVVLTS